MAAEAEKRPVRSDGVLNTGFTSATQRRAEDRARRQRELRDGKRASMTPGAEIIKAWIDQEEADVYKDIAKLPVTMETTDVQIKSVLMAYQMHLNFLTRLKSKTRNVLREVKVAEKAAAADKAEKSEAYKAFEREAAES